MKLFILLSIFVFPSLFLGFFFFNVEVKADVCKGNFECWTDATIWRDQNGNLCDPALTFPPNTCDPYYELCARFGNSYTCESIYQTYGVCDGYCTVSPQDCVVGSTCRMAFCGDGICEADVENVVCGGGGYCWQDCSTLGAPGSVCTDGDGCPGTVQCNPGGGSGTYCKKNDINCPCGVTVNALSSDPSEACDVNIGSCTVPPCNPKQDYDEDTCSANCTDNSMPMCRYTVDARYRTVGNAKVAKSGEGVESILDKPADSLVKKFAAGVGHGGVLDDPIWITPNSSYGNHTGSGPVVAVENRANQGFCAQESFLTDHFPTVHDVNVLNYREIASAINTQAVANGSYEYTDADSKWSGSYYDSSTYTPPGPNDPLPADSTDIIIPYISNSNTVDSCDNKNPVVFNVVIRDGDDMREVDQINVLLADPEDTSISPLAVSNWTGGCGTLETTAAGNYFGVTLQKQAGGSWTINNLCGIPSTRYEFVNMDIGALSYGLLYKSSTPGDNFMNVAFAVKFNDDFPEGMMKLWVKARSSYVATLDKVTQTHYMYSGWDTNSNGGDVYSSDINWRWGIDFTAPGDTNNSYEMATAEIIKFNWEIADPKVGARNNVDGSGMRYMDFGCALPNDKNGPKGAKFSSYPFFTTPLPATWDQRLDTYVARMNDIFENCGFNKKWVQSGTEWIKSSTEIIPYFTLPVEDINKKVSFDGPNKEKSNPIPPNCVGGDGPPCDNIFETNIRKPNPYNYVGNAVTTNVPYREFKQMDFLRIYNQAGFTGEGIVNVPRYIAGVEEKKSYNLRALVADRACNVRLVEEDINVGGKWMQTAGAEVYTKEGFNTKLQRDNTPYFTSVSPFNNKNSMSTFGVILGPSQSITSNSYTILGSDEQYAESAHYKKNLGNYGLYDDDISEPDRSMITQEVFRDGGLWDRMFEAATLDEEDSGVDRTFRMRQDITLEPTDCNYCNTTPATCNEETKCWHNSWEKDLVRFVNSSDFPGGVIKMEVMGGDSVYFEGNVMQNFNKDLIFLFYRREGGSVQKLGRVHFWPATFGNATNNPRIIVLAYSDLFSTGSTGHDWEYEPKLRNWITTERGYANWNQVWRTDDNREVPDNNVVGSVNLDKHIYFEPQPPYPAAGSSAIEYGSTPGQVIDPGVDMYKMFVIVDGQFESQSEDNVSADPEELFTNGGPLTYADVVDRNFERMEIWGGVAARTMNLKRNLTALDNIYMPAEKFIFDAGIIDAFAKANRQMGIFSQNASSWQEIGINY